MKRKTEEKYINLGGGEVKNTTTEIYNIVTQDTFQNLDKILKKNIQDKKLIISERNEYSIDELLEDLPNCIDIIRKSCEDGFLDTIHHNQLNAIYQTLNQINQTINNINSAYQ